MVKKILYAEDDGNIREVAEQFLSELLPNYDVEVHEDGTSLRGRLEKDVDDVGVVITDHNMPGINGGEIIKEYAPKLKIPFILLYGGSEDIGEEAVKNGAFCYFRKPVAYVDIAKVIEEATDSI